MLPFFVKRRELFVLFLLLLLLISVTAPPIISAQESTPTEIPAELPLPSPSLIPTNTETPTIVPTDFPTAVPTAVPTEPPTPVPTDITPEVTPVVTDVPTALPIDTATATEAASPTATNELETALPTATLPSTLSTPTATAFPPEPPLTLLFTDTFDTGELYLWTLGAGWVLVPNEGGQALQVTNSDEPVTFVHNTIGNAAVQARFLMNSGMARMSLRQSDAGSYTALMDMNGQIGLYRSGQLIRAATVNPVAPGQWHILRLSAINDIVRVAVDSVEVIIVQDSAPLPMGTISFSGMGTGTLLVDDFELWTEVLPSLAQSNTSTESDVIIQPLSVGDPQYYYATDIVEYKRMMPNSDPGQVVFTNIGNILNTSDGLEAEILNSADNSGGQYPINHACIVVSFGGTLQLQNGAIQALARNLWGGPDTMNLAVEASSRDLRCDDGPWDFGVIRAPATTAAWYGGTHTGDVRTVRIRVWSNANILHRQRKMFIDAIRIYGTYIPDLPVCEPINLVGSQKTGISPDSVTAFAGGYSRCDIELELADYNVIVADINSKTVSGDWYWTDGEEGSQLDAVRDAVVDTATAIQQFMNSRGSTYTTPADAFKAVMLFDLNNQIRIERRFGNGEYNCETNPLDPAQSPPFMASIACGYSTNITKYTITHELGHVFKHRTTQIVEGHTYPCFDDGSTKSFVQCMQNPDPANTNRSLGYGTEFVYGTRAVAYQRKEVDYIFQKQGVSPESGLTADDFGPYKDFDPITCPQNCFGQMAQPSDDWLRGTRGWGSGAVFSGPCGQAVSGTLPPPSDFQQNACNIYPWLETRLSRYTPAELSNAKVTEVEEAGADMFLNWVYRTLGTGGFRNVEWGNSNSCSNAPCLDTQSDYGPYQTVSDNTGPGSDRWRFMDNSINAFKAYYGW